MADNLVGTILFGMVAICILKSCSGNKQQEQTPAPKAPVTQTPGFGTPIYQEPAQGYYMPVQQMPVQPMPVQQIPIQQIPVQQMPVIEYPPEITPVFQEEQPQFIKIVRKTYHRKVIWTKLPQQQR